MIILLNGPSNSGKDTVCKLIRKILGRNMTVEYKMNRPLRRAFKEMFGMDSQLTDYLLNEGKDKPLFQDNPITPRQWIINTSNYMIETFGEDIFGAIAVHSMAGIAFEHCVIDCGLAPEIKPLQKRYGYDKVHAIQLSRTGCNYDNDSRSNLDFVKLDVPFINLVNDYELELLERQVEKILIKWELISDE